MTDRRGSTSDATPPPASTPLALVHRMVSRFAGNAIILAWTPLAVLDAMVLNATRAREHPALFALPIASLLSGAVLRYFADRAPRVGAALFLAAGGTGVAIGMLINGLMAANSIAAAVLVVWAALFFGPRGLTLAIASYLAIAATEVVLVLRAPSVLPAPLAPNMRDPVTWLRLSIWGASGLAIVGIIVLQVIRIYRDGAEREAQARRDLEAQNAALRAARVKRCSGASWSPASPPASRTTSSMWCRPSPRTRRSSTNTSRTARVARRSTTSARSGSVRA
ncbi:MAG: hypothetical protein K2X99_10385 [Gemmatimonadaceae bacterium]|nr:hypothetical protein [Gemmatimonadaceae bacterium]